MNRTFKYELLDAIPSLAWLMKITKNEEVLVKHGKMVETRDRFFVSGVWDGNFEEGNFVSANFSCCSGGIINNDGDVIITTPSHLQEAVFSLSQTNYLIISNSLPFLLSEVNMRLDENYHQYEADFCSVVFGEKDAAKFIPLLEGCRVRMHRNCNMSISDYHRIKEVSKCVYNRFNNYNEYFNFLHGVLQRIKDNATDGKRKFSYGMISTISQGYDATAVSALAADLGCKEVITLRTPANDNGKSIALKLGYTKVHEIERDAFEKNEILLEAEAAASGQVGGMIFEAYENYCSGKLIFMGTRGDSIWEKSRIGVNEELAFPYNGYAQASLSPTEHLFRINSIIIHVPLIGAVKWPEIAQISNSDEMKPWSVGGVYDRPIARRLVEEKGVLRKEFGTIKLGAGVSFHFNTLTSLKRKMSPTSYKSLIAYKAQNKSNSIKSLLFKVSFILSEFPVFFNYLMSKYKIRFFIDERMCGHKSSPVGNLMILWGVNEMTKRYKL